MSFSYFSYITKNCSSKLVNLIMRITITKRLLLLLRSLLLFVVLFIVTIPTCSSSIPHRILLDTDFDTDDFFAMLYLLKLNRSELDLQAITVNTNAWSNAGHAVNQIYDILYMMNRDDIAVGVGGEGGILEDGTIQPNVGGYMPIIDQGSSTAGPCRYRQAIPVGSGGRLFKDTNFGYRKSFLPQGSRRYTPLKQRTAQNVLIEKISKGPISLFVIGAHTNVAIFLMTNPHLKKNIEHIYIMGGGVRSKNPTGCCSKNARSSCKPQQCGDRGNIFTGFRSNPYAEFNFFADPFAAYQVIHSGIPVTLVPLDATNTIPITKKFFEAFKRNRRTYEAQYAFMSLKMVRDTWFDDQFYKSCFMWDSFMSGVATSIMRNLHKHQGENEFAKMEYMNISVVTSNKPYGISDGSNNFFDGLNVPKFNLTKNGVHSGHVQTGIRDPFCLQINRTERCKDGYTQRISGPDSVRVLIATRAKPNRDKSSSLNREFFISYLDVLNRQQNQGKFNFTSQFPYYKKVLYKPDFEGKKLGKIVVFDMDMSAGDFLALFYLLKIPVETINLKAILVTPTGWANAATIDVIYDLLHMMGRDDILVGLGDSFGLNQSYPNDPSIGNCKYSKAIPHGSGGFLDADTLFGLARDLPRSPRRYTAENFIKFGAPRTTDFPKLRQPLALEVWRSIVKSVDLGSKITILTNGPMTTLAKIILADTNANAIIQDVYILGGHIDYDNKDLGNVIGVPSNKYAELNIFLDPLAAKVVFDSVLDITLIPLKTQRKISSFPHMIKRLSMKNRTPEAHFSRRLLTRLYHLQQRHHRYRHMHTFLGEILGAVLLTTDQQTLNPTFQVKHLKVHASGLTSKDGQIYIDNEQKKSFRVLKKFDETSCYDVFANLLASDKQSAVVGSFREQKRHWKTPDSKILRDW
ncbi:nucleoside hydrolase 3-like [Rutidosis leptorrhynchoides]|uniref:nucleoside hydrolase 3-like n=1 Tax=Rutidosis leptorrhynchoides TaxID=125765 RepID=UPI003A98FD7A